MQERAVEWQGSIPKTTPNHLQVNRMRFITDRNWGVTLQLRCPRLIVDYCTNCIGGMIF